MFAQPQLRPIKNRSESLEDVTVREFGGGWNIVDNDLNLSTRFSVLLDNVSREEDGSNGVRWGTRLLADMRNAPVSMNDATDHVVNFYYFQDRFVAVMTDGRIGTVLADGTIALVWDTTIANGLVGAPAGWGPTDFVSFAVFNGKLIVCNGTDKPLIIDFDNTPNVQYLADEATGSNVNVPICRYIIAAGKYVVMAGDPLFPDRVHISNQNTSGTWYGDAAPNDATYVDLGKVGVQGEQTITGINRYRDQLVVGFYGAAVLGKLGIYNTADPPIHTPDFNDVIEGFGCHSHRSMVNLGNDLFMLDDVGITSIARSLYSGSTEPKRVSELVDPAINRNINRLVAADTVLGAHAIYNSNDKQYMCFVPNFSETARDLFEDPFEILQNDPTALRVRIPNHGLRAGDSVRFDGITDWNDIVADTSLNGLVHEVQAVIDEDIFQIVPENAINSDPNKAITGGGAVGTWTPQWTETIGYIYTFVNELKIRAWSRYRGWKWRASAKTELGRVAFADDTRIYVYGNQNDPIYKDFVDTSEERGIDFTWELPWADFDQRGNIKHTRYIMLDVRGTSTFNLMMFVDELYKREGFLTPLLNVEFVGGDGGGYGNGPQAFGGGRGTRTQNLYEWPARGKIFKMRFQGTVDGPLRFVAFTLFYQNGGIRR